MDSSTLYFIYFLAAIGGIWFVLAISSCMWTLIRMLLPRKDLIYDYGDNTWAVITGASDGIGLAFAKELAKEKFHICLVARNRKKLEAVENQIKGLYPEIKTYVVVADFADSQKEGFFERIVDELKPLEISILINNAGMVNMGKFQQIAPNRLIEQINVNCLPPSVLTNLLLPDMLKRDHRSAIINVSSTAALFPCPYTSNYSGTKGFGTMLSKGIQLQFQDKIDTLCVQPMVVETKLSKQSGRWDIVSTEQCAVASLDALGYDNVTKGHWKHRFIGWITAKLPNIIINYSTKTVMAKALKIDDKPHSQ